jgi:hypothetical protein
MVSRSLSFFSVRLGRVTDISWNGASVFRSVTPALETNPEKTAVSFNDSFSTSLVNMRMTNYVVSLHFPGENKPQSGQAVSKQKFRLFITELFNNVFTYSHRTASNGGTNLRIANWKYVEENCGSLKIILQNLEKLRTKTSTKVVGLQSKIRNRTPEYEVITTTSDAGNADNNRGITFQRTANH